ncbi:hypothetical protein NDU88_008189 [Pleurodeles waltl]|uniref:Uncharacterized protein n=1 Tax=Pleurodeles waltl TaxID=8319 RepID=A0AAV7VUF1_PLEWA|nr:hypothetical protein NDU88_008189 [Pleurodeles waltl]
MNTSGSDVRFIPPAAPALHHYRFACRRVGFPTWTSAYQGDLWYEPVYLIPERAIRNEYFRVRRSFYSSGSTRFAPLQVCMPEGRFSDLDIGLSTLPLVCGESFFCFLSPERAIRNEYFRVRRSFYSSGSTRFAPLQVCMPEGRFSNLDIGLSSDMLTSREKFSLVVFPPDVDKRCTLTNGRFHEERLAVRRGGGAAPRGEEKLTIEKE